MSFCFAIDFTAVGAGDVPSRSGFPHYFDFRQSSVGIATAYRYGDDEEWRLGAGRVLVSQCVIERPRSPGPNHLGTRQILPGCTEGHDHRIGADGVPFDDDAIRNVHVPFGDTQAAQRLMIAMVVDRTFPSIDSIDIHRFPSLEGFDASTGEAS